MTSTRSTAVLFDDALNARSTSASLANGAPSAHPSPVNWAQLDPVMVRAE
ncbi:MAG: hypothetical protein ACR2P2_03950 [Nakamurella sp.]